MPLSTILKTSCSVCGKAATEKNRFQLGDKTIITLECGHITTSDKLAATDYSSIVSSDSRRLMPYQVAGVQFLEQSNAKALIADEQGLGKTIQALAALKLHSQGLLPVVIVTKTTVKHQWHTEVRRWCGINGFLCQVINSSKEKASGAFQVYIVTYDMLKTVSMFEDVNIKTLIIDECQAIKNHLSDRAKAVQRIAKSAEHIIALSGTPIKNNAGEYFTILNILQPSRFPHYQSFIDRYCDAYWSGFGNKVGGLRNPELFQDMTKDFIIRRTKNEVLPDLPALERKFRHVELDRKLNKAYNAALDELDELYYSEQDDNTMTNMLAIYSKMRQITGISKVAECVDDVTEFLPSTDRKIVIFVHHHAVANLLQNNLDSWCNDGGYHKPLMLTAELDGSRRAALVEQFKSGEARIMIASTLAAGEGLNLQFCSDAIVLERQWNPANEEQAEGRFHRFGQVNPVSVTYMIASETIDDYFTRLVEQKRSYISGALDGKVVQWEQSSLMKELLQLLVTTGRKRWKL